MELEEAVKDIKRICEYLKESNYMSIDKDTKISLETVLNYLKQKEHELNSQKNYCKMIEEQKDDIIKSMAERMSKQEKMIELMAYEIDRLDDGSVTYSGHENFIENIKQYFERKAEESK